MGVCNGAQERFAKETTLTLRPESRAKDGGRGKEPLEAEGEACVK